MRWTTFILTIILATSPLFVISQKVLTGKASYYASKFHGRKTASGEIYNQNLLTAAHKTLPFGTKVKVTNLANNKSVVVKINDRGPFVKGRIIDLSLAAAKEVKMVQRGVVKVKVEILSKGKTSNNTKKKPFKQGTYNLSNKRANVGNTFGVQVASFKKWADAKSYGQKVRQKGFDRVYVQKVMVKGNIRYRVLAGSFDTRTKAQKAVIKAKKKGLKGHIVEHI